MRADELKEAGSILLLSCYELGHQPMGLASPAAFLERAGFRPSCLDTAVDALHESQVRSARLVCISVPMHTALRLGSRIAKRVREWNPDCHICFFGLYASLNAEFLLRGTADSVIGGEYEEEIVRLAQRLNTGSKWWSMKIGSSPACRSPLERLSFPVPQRSILPPLERYARLERGDGRFLVGYVEASRGCKHLCLHCPIPPVYGGRFFVVARQVVLEDIRRLVRLGAEHITFGDPDFLNGSGHAIRIVKLMHAEFPGLTFDFTARIEHLLLKRHLMREFAACGCVFIVSALESLSDTVLSNLEKGHTRADFFEALKIVRDAGIVLRPSLVSFTPWTTLDDYLEVLVIAEREGLLDCIDPVQYSVRLLVPPGSWLLSSPAMQPYLAELKIEDFTYAWTHPNPRMDRLCETVTAVVRSAVSDGEDPLRTVARIRRLALAERDEHIPEYAMVLAKPTTSRTVRITEPWFC